MSYVPILFDREELLSSAVGDSSSDGFMPSLNNELHSIFKRPVLNKFSQEEYEAYRPALQLASMYLQHDTCIEWWCTLVLGSPRKQTLYDSKKAPYAAMVMDPVRPTQDNVQKTRKFLEGHAKNVEFVWHARTERVIAMTVRNFVRVPRPNGKTDIYQKAQIQLPPVWDTFIKAMARTLNLDPAQRLPGPSEATLLSPNSSRTSAADMNMRLRFFCHVAATLVHEVAHSVYQQRFEHGAIGTLGKEPLYSLADYEGEIGQAWEEWLFGGLVRSVNCSLVPVCGLLVWHFRGEESEAANLMAAIPMACVQKLLSKDFWDPTDPASRTLELRSRLMQPGYVPIRSATASTIYNPNLGIPDYVDQWQELSKRYADEYNTSQREGRLFGCPPRPHKVPPHLPYPKPIHLFCWLLGNCSDCH